MQNNRILALCAGIALALACTVAEAEQGQWKYTMGIDYSSGDYGGDPVDTKITYMPFITSYRSGSWTLKATVPWVQIEGAGTVIGAGDGGVVIGSGQNQSTSESGLGDIWLGASHNIDAVSEDLFYLDLAAKVKLPTADEDKGLGTGEVDYTVQADIYKPMGDRMPFATLAYKIKGDPAGIELDNVLYASLGTDFVHSELTHLGLTLDYQEAATDSADHALEAMAYINRKLDDRWSLMFYGYKGLADGSPDYGGGLQLSYKPQP